MSAALKDAIVLLAIVVLVAAVSISIDGLERIVQFAHQHESWEIDEIITAALALTLGLMFFSYRRWRESKRELDGRIKAEMRISQQTAMLQEQNAELEAHTRRLVEHQKAIADANRTLAEAHATADAANQAKSQFLANMSHEIRTPMTAILGFSDILEEQLSRPGVPRDQTVAIQTICSNGRYLLEIINDILDISKIEAGRMVVENAPTSLVRLLAEIESLMRARAKEKDLAFVVEYSTPIPELIQTDLTRLRQILINLIGNAVKFTEHGGVQLHVGLEGSSSEDHAIRFDVVDTGIGIPRESLAGLFRPFTQADTSMTRRFGGTGLGLTISKRLAAMLGGDIVVTSEAGVGSTFSVTIATGSLNGVRMVGTPEEASAILARQTPNKAPAQPQRHEDAPLSCRILLAEDGPDNQRLISYLLQKAGAEVVCVDDGLEAVERINAELAANDGKRTFDLILMDMQMPVLDGYKATRRLREEGYTGAIVALTAHAMSSDRDRCLRAGCDEHFSKPINRHKFIDLIARICAQENAKASNTQA